MNKHLQPITARASVKIKKAGDCGCKHSPNKKMKDLSGDGKITQKDVLIGRGVIPAPAPVKQTSLAQSISSQRESDIESGKVKQVEGAGERNIVSGTINIGGPSGIAGGIKAIAGSLAKINNPTTAKIANSLLNISNKMPSAPSGGKHVGPKFGKWSSKRGQRRSDGTRY